MFRTRGSCCGDTLKVGISVHTACKHPPWLISSIQASACLRYNARFQKSTWKLGHVVQELFDQRLVPTFTMPASARCLQYNARFLSRALKLCRFLHDWCEQRLVLTCTVPSSACYLQYKTPGFRQVRSSPVVGCTNCVKKDWCLRVPRRQLDFVRSTTPAFCLGYKSSVAS